MGSICVFLVLYLCSFVSSASVLTTSAPETSLTECSSVKQIFQLKNITAAVPDTPITNGSGVCRSGASCCSPEMELTLQHTVTRELHGLLHHNFQSIHGMLATTASALQEHVRSIARESENKTMSVFAEVYKGMWGLAKGPISELYGSLLAYLEKAQKIPTDLPPSVPTEDAHSLQKTVFRFFRDMFPLVYHQAVHHLHTGDFTPEYKACLRDAVERAQPFGEYPKALAIQVAKSFEATKVLMEALSLGIEVLNGTDRAMGEMSENPDSCREALVRLYYCPRCLGLPPRVKPCNGYCLNVMRGCLTQQRTTELDLPWSNFLQETERLVKELHSGRTPSVEHVIHGFSSTIPDAIMYATMNGPALEKKVKKACGVPKLSGERGRREEGTTVTQSEVSSGARRERSALALQLEAFLEASTKARGFYANLAEALCSDDSFAETRDTAECWNGHRVGEYTKALVRPGVDAQKYNPELKWREAAPDPTIRQLSDKLRHMRQVVLSRVGQEVGGPESDSLLREGSGSGAGPRDWSPRVDDEDDTDWADQGSGSGAGPSDPFMPDKHVPDVSIQNYGHPSLNEIGKNDVADAGHQLESSSFTILLSLLLFCRWHH